MRVYVKTLKGTNFAIEVEPEHTIADVKKNIENVEAIYPAEQQLLVYQGKVLKNETTILENQVSEDSFIVIMLTKTKASSSGAATTTAAPAKQASSTSPVTPDAPIPASQEPPPLPVLPQANEPAAETSPAATASMETETYGQAASNLVAGNSFEQAVQGILDMGGGTWDRDHVVRALRAAFNNPERAVDYLYSGIPEQAEVPTVAALAPSGAQTVNPTQASQPVNPAPVPSGGGPNANPLDLFPQGLPNMGSANAGAGNLDFLRNSPQFRALQTMVQANPQILQPMLQELGKQNPQIMRLIQEHQADFLRLLNEPVEGGEGNLLGQLGQLEGATPQSVQVTEEEAEAIQRLEAMGFDRAIVLEVFFACNKNEELAANYLLDHIHEFED